MSVYVSQYSVDDCDAMIIEYWEQWKKSPRSSYYDFVDYWLEERWRAMGNAVEGSEG